MTHTLQGTLTYTTDSAVEYADFLAAMQSHPDVSSIIEDAPNLTVTFSYSSSG